MPIYDFKGLSEKGKPKKGLREADTIKSLRIALRKDGIFATEISKSSATIQKKVEKDKSFLLKDFNIAFLTKRVSVEDLAISTRQLGTLLKAGVPMIEALVALIEQIENRTLKEAFSQIKADVNEGSSLAEAMFKHKCFTSLFVNMVRAGETSGALEVVLERLADFSESQAQLRSKVTGAMLYPAIMIVVAGMVLVVMFTVVVPRITKIFDQANVSLPLITQILIATSNFTKNYWWLVLAVLTGSHYLFSRWKKTPGGKAKWDKFYLSAPVFGSIVSLVAVARFARTLSTLLSSGVPLLTSLSIVRNVVANNSLEVAIDDVKEAVQEGEDIATPLKRSGHFPPMVTHMIAIGEKSGQLESMLGRIADSYEQRVQVKVAMLSGLLEPFMILFMGGTVAFIVFSILLPIMKMNQLVR